MLASSLTRRCATRLLGIQSGSVEKNAERLEQREECARLTDAVFEMLKREIAVAVRETGRSLTVTTTIEEEVGDATPKHNYAANVATFQKSLKL